MIVVYTTLWLSYFDTLKSKRVGHPEILFIGQRWGWGKSHTNYPSEMVTYICQTGRTCTPGLQTKRYNDTQGLSNRHAWLAAVLTPCTCGINWSISNPQTSNGRFVTLLATCSYHLTLHNKALQVKHFSRKTEEALRCKGFQQAPYA